MASPTEVLPVFALALGYQRRQRQSSNIRTLRMIGVIPGNIKQIYKDIRKGTLTNRVSAVTMLKRILQHPSEQGKDWIAKVL